VVAGGPPVHNGNVRRLLSHRSAEVAIARRVDEGVDIARAVKGSRLGYWHVSRIWHDIDVEAHVGERPIGQVENAKTAAQHRTAAGKKHPAAVARPESDTGQRKIDRLRGCGGRVENHQPFVSEGAHRQGPPIVERFVAARTELP
jgi:hypothetical protein